MGACVLPSILKGSARENTGRLERNAVQPSRLQVAVDRLARHPDGNAVEFVAKAGPALEHVALLLHGVTREHGAVTLHGLGADEGALVRRQR